MPGEPAPQDVVQDGQVSSSSLLSWAYIAVPLEPSRSGVRGSCADMSGAICTTPDGSAPDVSYGECPVWNEDGPGGCTPLY